MPPQNRINHVVVVVAGAPVDPADEPLDALGKEWMEGIIKLTSDNPALMAIGAAMPASTPTTQGAASDFVEQRIRTAFGI